MLTKNKKEYFRKWLTGRLNESVGRAHGTLAALCDPEDKPFDLIDQAASCSDMGFVLRIIDREAKLIKKLEEALQRLEDGTFGICEECGEEIPLKRLMARPVTTLCIKCKKEQEAAEKVTGEHDLVSVY